MPRVATVLFALSLVVAAGCGPLVINGNGIYIQEPRTVAPFTGVSVSNGIHAVVTVGSPQSVVLSGDANIVSRIDTVVVNGNLETHLVDASGFVAVHEIRLDVTVPALTFAGASSGAVDASGVASDALEVAATKEGRVNVAGQGKILTVQMSGGSTIDTLAFPAEQLHVTGDGSSHGECYASVSADGALSGGTFLRVVGNPFTRTVTLSGSSIVTYE